MNLKEAKDIFEEISELCNRIEDANLIKALESIYQDIEKAETVYSVVELTSDLMFYVDDISWDDEEIEQVKLEIQDLYNTLRDEAE
jgi:predicted AlkP superfamily phosphohydrolase/phosphomutase